MVKKSEIFDSIVCILMLLSVGGGDDDGEDTSPNNKI